MRKIFRDKHVQYGGIVSSLHNEKQFGYEKNVLIFLLLKICKSHLPKHAILNTVNYFSAQILQCGTDADDSR